MHCHNKNDKSRVMWFRLEILKLRGLRTGVGKVRWSAYKEEENEVRIPLEGTEMPGWKEEILNKKRLQVNEEIVHEEKLVVSVLISNFRRVVNVVCFLFGDSPSSELYVPMFPNTVSSS